MTNPKPVWGRYEQLRPDRLAAIREQTPVAYWPLGLLEHHGWALPVGFDGLKAERLCVRMAEHTGGVVLPVMWWGSGGGHGAFNWTLYQPREAVAAVFETTVRGLLRFGFRCIVLLCGHYPWRGILGEVLPRIEKEFPNACFIQGTEADIAERETGLGGDHAAFWETSYGLALMPELVDMGALRPHDTGAAWPQGGGPPEQADRHPGVIFDAADSLFAQMGEDARGADGEAAGALLETMVADVTQRVRRVLEGGEESGGKG